MPNPSGQIRWLSGHPYVRIRLPDQRRPTIRLGCSTREEASRRVAIVSDIVTALRNAGRETLIEELATRAAKAVSSTDLEGVRIAVRAICAGEVAARPAFDQTITFRQFSEKWTSGELHDLYKRHVKRKKTASFDRGLFRTWVYPRIGDLPLMAITSDHCEEVLNDIPSDRSEHLVRHVAQVMNRTFKLAVFPAKILKASPLPAGFLPRIEKEKARTYLLPADDRVLLRCPDIYVVLRLFYGLLAREGMRRDEALTLDFCNLDLENGAVHLDTNKTDDPRWWALDPGVAEALWLWKRHYHPNPAPTSRVFVYPAESRQAGRPLTAAIRAEEFRAHLRRAGIRRHQLFENTADRRHVCIHDLRATFVTVSLANGRSETWVQDRTGHKSSEMINEYRRQARTHAELRLGVLTPLAEAIPELAAVRNREPALHARGAESSGLGSPDRAAE